MKLISKKIGEFVEQYSEKCNIPNLTVYDVSGVNREKEFFEPSQQVGKDTSNYKIVPPGYFACNLMHVGRDVVLPISLNTNQTNKVVSPAYFVFFINREDIILKEFFFIYLNSIEKDRFFWFHTDSSVRDGLSWNDFCDLEIPIPSIDVQKKYVDIYNSLLENQKAFERGTKDLKLVCDAYMNNMKKKNKARRIQEYIFPVDLKVKNSMNKLTINNIRGISSIEKKFIETKADTNVVSIDNYKVVPPMHFAFNPNTARMGDKIPIALNDTKNNLVVSAIYPVFKCNEKNIVPQYLLMFFNRSEFDRYARYHSWGSARETFNMQDMNNVKIPIPSLEIQQDIVNIYKAYNKRKNIAEKLKEQIKNICPVLIAGAIKEGEKANG